MRKKQVSEKGVLNHPKMCCFFQNVKLHCVCSVSLIVEIVCTLYLAVKPQENNHDEEEGGPQRRERHHAHSAGVSYEGQARTYGDQ